jgi:hypothetical protein
MSNGALISTQKTRAYWTEEKFRVEIIEESQLKFFTIMGSIVYLIPIADSHQCKNQVGLVQCHLVPYSSCHISIIKQHNNNKKLPNFHRVKLERFDNNHSEHHFQQSIQIGLKQLAWPV